jgi:hypothetical protein
VVSIVRILFGSPNFEIKVVTLYQREAVSLHRNTFLKYFKPTQTQPHCVNQMGKTHSKPLAARYGRGTARAWHAMCELALTHWGPGI